LCGAPHLGHMLEVMGMKRRQLSRRTKLILDVLIWIVVVIILAGMLLPASSRSHHHPEDRRCRHKMSYIYTWIVQFREAKGREPKDIAELEAFAGKKMPICRKLGKPYTLIPAPSKELIVCPAHIAYSWFHYHSLPIVLTRKGRFRRGDIENESECEFEDWYTDDWDSRDFVQDTDSSQPDDAK